MFKIRQITLLVLALLFFVTIGNTIAEAQELNINEMRMYLNNIEKDLRTPFAKEGLEITVWNFYRARVVLSPNKYESTCDFQKGFLQSFLLFQNRLRTGNLGGLKLKVDYNFLIEMTRSYERNESRYLDFIKSISKTPYFPPNYTVDFVTKSQFYYSLILLDADKTHWSNAKKFTYIFPFCDD